MDAIVDALDTTAKPSLVQQQHHGRNLVPGDEETLVSAAAVASSSTFLPRDRAPHSGRVRTGPAPLLASDSGGTASAGPRAANGGAASAGAGVALGECESGRGGDCR
ncbi:unnamed protein product [Miscanthus lutarioriparius]|uniref:Uncharacterized protein n=1 Tax=Miscanthus lutarioriparius TaxID=422564 RepID=A0A811PA53_9POAL|nr:unnamed protein product [Miscanthus lutarioriparius]